MVQIQITTENDFEWLLVEHPLKPKHYVWSPF